MKAARRFSRAFALSSLLATAISCAASVTTVSEPSDCNRFTGEATTYLRLPGNPFQAIPTDDGCWIFVSMLQGERGSRNGIAVVRRSEGKVDLVRVIDDLGGPAGMTLTHDGRLLIAAARDRVDFLDVARLMSGAGDPLLGKLDEGRPVGAIEATVTANDSLLFVSNEHGGGIIAIDLFKTRQNWSSEPTVIGRAPVTVPVSVVLSPDEKLLYVSAMSSPAAFGWPSNCHGLAADALARAAQGGVIVIDVMRLASGRPDAVIGKVPAGCSVVRVALSPGGDTLFATVRWDDALVAFDARRILTDPAHALIARVHVGQEPVGVLPILGGKRILVANSHRFAADASGNQTVSVVDASRLTDGANAVIASIPAGAFPRELMPTRDGRTILLTNFGSKTLEIIDVIRIPAN